MRYDRFDNDIHSSVHFCLFRKLNLRKMLLIGMFTFFPVTWRNIWTFQLIQVICQNKNCNSITSKCTILMETTNSMAVNSSNHLFIGMVSLLIHVQWPKSRHSISEIYLVIHIVGITKIYHHQLQFFAKISWNQLLRCFHEFFSKVRVNFSFFHTVKSTKIIITPI